MATLVKSPSHCENDAVFTISDRGISDLEYNT
jgi:hypothetical protein